jgi:hypothetical protein
MDNDYTQFSEVLPNLTDEEVQWLTEQLETDYEDLEVLYEFDTDEQPDGWGRYLWLYADESADLEQVAGFVQKFLRHSRPDQYWSLTFACTCSKPRVGAFGGGAAFVTANDIQWQDSYSFIEAEAEAFSASAGESHVSRLVQLAEQKSLEEDALDEVVRDVASEHAASVNNGGLAGQIAYLIEELGADETERVLNGLSANCSDDNSN